MRFQKLIKEKEELLDGLWAGWVECVREIEILDRDGGVSKRGDGLLSTEDRHKTPDEALDDKEFDNLVEEIKMVGRVWARKMEDSEKVCILSRNLASLFASLFDLCTLTCSLQKIAHEVLQQQQLAATVLL